MGKAKLDQITVWLYRRLRLPIRLKQKLIWLLHPKYCIGVLAYIPHPQDSDRILLADHPYRGAISWSLPGGLVGRGEAPEQAVKREMREELGVEIEIQSLMRAVKSEFGISLDLVYACRLVSAPDEFKLSREIGEAAFFSLDSLPTQLMYSQHVMLIRELAEQISGRWIDYLPIDP